LVCSLLASLEASAGDLKASPGGSDTVIIEADRLDVDSPRGTAVFKGNVKAVKGAINLRAQTVTLKFDRASKKVDTLSASGSVLISWGDRQAECARAVYHLQDQVMELSGNVSITRGTESISGDRVTVDLKRDIQTAEGGGGRVKVRVEAKEGSGIMQWSK
jgi:lipopolysaccharide export system protein LptA